MATMRQTDNIKKNSFERAAWHQKVVIIGIDEVGRGCFAGPVVAAAVILPVNKAHAMLKDSKIMTTSERNKAFGWIVRNCTYGVGIAHHRAVDEKNIWQTTLVAMKRALMQVLAISSKPSFMVLTDAMPLDLSDTQLRDVPVYYFNKGESKSSSIAAASIVAKVIRDEMMSLYDVAMPGYGLTDNKGYGTSKHREAIEKYSYSCIHRVSFLRKTLQVSADPSTSSG